MVLIGQIINADVYGKYRAKGRHDEGTPSPSSHPSKLQATHTVAPPQVINLPQTTLLILHLITCNLIFSGMVNLRLGLPPWSTTKSIQLYIIVSSLLVCFGPKK